MSDSRKQRNQGSVRLTDAQIRDHLNAIGFYHSWITQDLIDAQRKILEAKIRSQARLANAGDYD
jgi:hypothetical protein